MWQLLMQISSKLNFKIVVNNFLFNVLMPPPPPPKKKKATKKAFIFKLQLVNPKTICNAYINQSCFISTRQF